jgi:hypothetical protein
MWATFFVVVGIVSVALCVVALTIEDAEATRCRGRSA